MIMMIMTDINDDNHIIDVEVGVALDVQDGKCKDKLFFEDDYDDHDYDINGDNHTDDDISNDNVYEIYYYGIIVILI